jgi:hypothetical protein
MSGDRLARGLDIATEVDDLETVACVLVIAAEIARRQGLFEESARLLGSSQATFARFGETRWEMERAHWQPTLEGLARALPSAQIEELRSDGAARPIEESIAAALAAAAT